MRLGYGVSPRSRTSLLALALVASACSTAKPQPPAELDFEPGRYTLEATVGNRGGAAGEAPTRYEAELLVSLTGAVSLSSSTGLCRDPAFPNADVARGEKSFECGEATYHLKPGARSVVGEITAPVTVEKTVTECVRYVTNPTTGQQTCAETRQRVERTTVMTRSRLRVHMEPVK